MNIIRSLVQERITKRIRNAHELLCAQLIKKNEINACDKAAKALPIGLPAELAARLRNLKKDDPLRLQFIPSAKENDILVTEFSDPIGDTKHQPVKGIIHRYQDRALLMPVFTCPVYCRFCFRRNSIGSQGLGEQELMAALAYIEATPKIWEVILTGGDPLILSPRKLSKIMMHLEKIPHVETIRIHTRVPALSPERISSNMVDAIKVKTPVWIVLHCNHADEINAPACAAIAKLIDSGIPMLSQTVLLKGINDSPDSMDQLMRTLIKNRIKPYYLHHADLAQGTSHFRTSLRKGRDLVKALRRRLSGIAQPTYVLDIPGGHGKVPAGPCWLKSGVSQVSWVAEDFSGKTHIYPDQIESEERE